MANHKHGSLDIFRVSVHWLRTLPTIGQAPKQIRFIFFFAEEVKERKLCKFSHLEHAATNGSMFSKLHCLSLVALVPPEGVHRAQLEVVAASYQSRARNTALIRTLSRNSSAVTAILGGHGEWKHLEECNDVCERRLEPLRTLRNVCSIALRADLNAICLVNEEPYGGSTEGLVEFARSASSL
ncbi:uncharacterized protein LOC112344137 [Selaginella moellendorffii]|uniref:uncharacterized protein LOC112344137 n=1 Tax=Selaginella moellendorffii TaxID=88036 RepID=UPI000D1C5942|nr:uncharacterized protein LOC112344137 [Selaginella moellendorffii]XP_024524060.1 uncharacterized protein LOC112344137 [Selaginella moellendorffii]|eukprot:XP_024524059.1 uncharacterized protein LOC112344137 [Selaginella moellendorffii]